MIFGFYSILAGAAYFFGKCINDAADRDVAEANYFKSGRKERDRLHRLFTWTSLPYYERKELLDRAGRWPSGGPIFLCRYISKESNFEIAVNQIALKEGWSYQTDLRDCDTLKGTYFVDLFGEEWRNKGYCTYKEVAQAMNEETERREVWRKRCPRSSEVDVAPMNCEDEEDYRRRVKEALTKRWCKKYTYAELPVGLNAYDYEDEEDFLKAKEQLDQYYGRYQTYRDVKISDRYYTSRDIDKIEEFVSRYDAKNITQDNIIEMFEYVRHKIVHDSRGYKLLKEKLELLGYTISYDTESINHPNPILLFPKRKEETASLPSPTPEQNSQNEPNDPAEPGPETSGTAVSEPKPVKTEFIVPPIGYGKIYTMQRGNKKSKLTLTKRM